MHCRGWYGFNFKRSSLPPIVFRTLSATRWSIQRPFLSSKTRFGKREHITRAVSRNLHSIAYLARLSSQHLHTENYPMSHRSSSSFHRSVSQSFQLRSPTSRFPATGSDIFRDSLPTSTYLVALCYPIDASVSPSSADLEAEKIQSPPLPSPVVPCVSSLGLLLP